VSGVAILARGCTCGHAEADHQGDHTCPECRQEVWGDGHCEVVACKCQAFVARCQNCGERRRWVEGDFDVCSRPCLLQLEYAQQLLSRSDGVAA
jgi:hypothetical protein